MPVVAHVARGVSVKCQQRFGILSPMRVSDLSSCGRHVFPAPRQKAQVSVGGGTGPCTDFWQKQHSFFAVCCFFAALESLLNLSRVIYNCDKWDPRCWSTKRGGRGGIAPETRAIQTGRLEKRSTATLLSRGLA